MPFTLQTIVKKIECVPNTVNRNLIDQYLRRYQAKISAHDAKTTQRQKKERKFQTIRSNNVKAIEKLLGRSWQEEDEIDKKTK